MIRVFRHARSLDEADTLGAPVAGRGVGVLMFKKLMGLAKKSQRDLKAVQQGRGEDVARQRGRTEATKRAPGGATGRKLVGKLFR